ncbi:hypothetical protein TDB9533_04129 [Thalassocella blandensis]|nr:hypothetical protein TDB9533_04129 [Thalassocella blandensis]
MQKKVKATVKGKKAKQITLNEQITSETAGTQEINQAIEQGIRAYFNTVRKRIPAFIHLHFRYPGCWHIHKQAFGLDLLRAPLNLLWAPIYLLANLFAFILGKMGLDTLCRQLKRLPPGFEGRVQRHINALIVNELFSESALRQCISEHVTSALKHSTLEQDHNKEEEHLRLIQAQIEHILSDALSQLMQARIATADITNTLLSSAFGILFFKKFTPGGIGIGVILAAIWVKWQAVENFFLGSTLGSSYYALFPPTADLLTLSTSIAFVLLILAFVASFSGLITDPILAAIGFHKRRLNRLTDQIEKDVTANYHSRFKTLDPYFARILELFDTIKSHLTL